MRAVPIWDGKVPQELQVPTLVRAVGLFVSRIVGVMWLFNIWAYLGAVVLIVLGIKWYRNGK